MTTRSLNHEEANKAAVLRLYLECFNQGKLDAADQLISPQLNFVAPGPAGPAGPEGFKANVARLRGSFPDLRFTVNELVAENDRVAVYWTWEGTHQNTFVNIPPTGKRVQQEGMVLYHFADGKAVKARAQFDRLGVFQQLGVNPPSGASAAKPPTP
jgi:steroid delta-isomerase-like uncharacterized protein